MSEPRTILQRVGAWAADLTLDDIPPRLSMPRSRCRWTGTTTCSRATRGTARCWYRCEQALGAEGAGRLLTRLETAGVRARDLVESGKAT